MNRVSRNSKQFSNGFLPHALSVQLPNLANLLVIKFRLAVRRANVILSATFPQHIGMIIRFSAKEKMGRINARRIVTAMKNAQSLLKITKSKSIRKYMGFNLSAIYFDLSVSITIAATSPQPARFGFVNIMPKPFFRRSIEMILKGLECVAVFAKAFQMSGTKLASFKRFVAVVS